MFTLLRKIYRRIYGYFFPLNTKSHRIRFIVALVAIIALFIFTRGDDAPLEEISTLPPVVFVGTVSDIKNGSGTSFVGTVRAISEAQIQSEVGGRVTSVQVQPGDYVQAGTILASLENTLQQAALLQAQGAYEASLATAAQSEISVTDAENALLSAKNSVLDTYRSTYTSVNAIILNSVDIFFGNPNSVLSPGVRISTDGKAQYLNAERIALGKTLPAWRESSNTLSVDDNLPEALNTAREYVAQVRTLIDILITATSKADSSDTLDGQPVSSYTSDLTTARATLNSALNSLASAETTLNDAEENLRRARIGGTQSTEASLANAQVKQSLGVLRTAQANYEKTIFRTPISGTVNSMRVQVGDFISPFTQIAEVANNDALQVSMFVGENDIQKFAVGDTVTINNDGVGVVTAVAPAIDPITKKTEVKIATESKELVNGSTVTITLDATYMSESSPLVVPITAIKFTATDGFMFTVENGVLTSRPIQIGPISGSNVTIVDGIDMSTEFVIDARGLTDGERVEAVRK